MILVTSLWLSQWTKSISHSCSHFLSQFKESQPPDRIWISGGIFPGWKASDVRMLWFSGLPLILQRWFCSTCQKLLLCTAPGKLGMVTDVLPTHGLLSWYSYTLCTLFTLPDFSSAKHVSHSAFLWVWPIQPFIYIFTSWLLSSHSLPGSSEV
jgi:hypothetical protein